MTDKRLDPVQRCGGAGNRARNLIIATIDPDLTAEAIVLQFLSHRYGVPPAVAATIALLAGIGPKEARQ
jgi:hypothetical protein